MADMRERDEQVLAAVRELVTKKRKQQDEWGKDELGALAASKVDVQELAGREKSWSGGAWVRDEKRPFPDLTAGQVRPSLERLVAAGALRKIQTTRNRADYTLVEVSRRVEQLKAEREKQEQDTERRWSDVNAKLRARGLAEAVVGERFYSNLPKPFVTPLETIEALLKD